MTGERARREKKTAGAQKAGNGRKHSFESKTLDLSAVNLIELVRYVLLVFVCLYA